jgi:hypothetical protein
VNNPIDQVFPTTLLAGFTIRKEETGWNILDGHSRECKTQEGAVETWKSIAAHAVLYLPTPDSTHTISKLMLRLGGNDIGISSILNRQHTHSEQFTTSSPELRTKPSASLSSQKQIHSKIGEREGRLLVSGVVMNTCLKSLAKVKGRVVTFASMA